jgi:hypothetical protein
MSVTAPNSEFRKQLTQSKEVDLDFRIPAVTVGPAPDVEEGLFSQEIISINIAVDDDYFAYSLEMAKTVTLTEESARMFSVLALNPPSAVIASDLDLFAQATLWSDTQGAARNIKGSKSVAGLLANYSPARGAVMIGGSNDLATAGSTLTVTIGGVPFTTGAQAGTETNEDVANELATLINASANVLDPVVLIDGVNAYILLTSSGPNANLTLAVSSTGPVAANDSTPYRSGSQIGTYSASTAGYVVNQNLAPVVAASPVVSQNPTSRSTYCNPTTLESQIDGSGNSVNNLYVGVVIENISDEELTTNASCFVKAKLVQRKSVIEITE